MALPDLTYREQLPPIVAAELDQLIPRLAAYIGGRNTFAALTDCESWTNIPYASSLFSSEDSTPEWTVTQGGVATHKYMRLGSLLILQLSITRSVVAPVGPPTTLRVQLPDGLRAVPPRSGLASYPVGTCVWANDNGAIGTTNPLAGVGAVSVFLDPTKLLLTRNDTQAPFEQGFNASAVFHLGFTAMVELAQ